MTTFSHSLLHRSLNLLGHLRKRNLCCSARGPDHNIKPSAMPNKWLRGLAQSPTYQISHYRTRSLAHGKSETRTFESIRVQIHLEKSTGASKRVCIYSLKTFAPAQTMVSLGGRVQICLDRGQALATLGTTRLEHAPSANSRHAHTKTMSLVAIGLLWLVSPLGN